MKSIWLHCVLFFLVIHNNSAFNFRDKLNNAVSKAKNLYKNKFGKDKSWHFLGQDPSEYPGTDTQKRNIQSDKWSAYYECLKKQENNIGKHGSLIPEAVLALEGESLKFDCRVCISPEEQENIESVEWEWAHVDKNYLEPVEYGEHILLAPEDKTLHIYNVGIDQSGQYVCKLGKQLTAPYFLTVTNSSTLKKVHPKTAPLGPYREIPWKIHQEIVLDTTWGSWSQCSNCDRVGKRHRYGYCLIITLSNLEENNSVMEDNVQTETNGNHTHNRRDDSKETNNTTEELYNTTEPLQNITNMLYNTTDALYNTSDDIKYIDMMNDSVKFTKVDMEILHIFKYGIPCHSYILPTSVKAIPQIKNRKNEIMIGFCKEKCPEAKVFAVKDKDGNIIETANNSAGIYSTLQGLPPIEPSVQRRLIFASAKTNIQLICPGNLNTESPIKWQIGGRNIVPELLFQESGGRMFVSVTDAIHIKKLKISDSNIYSCWQDNELAGTIKLIVENTIKLNFNHHIILIGIIVILGTFVYVYVRAFLGRKHAKQ